MKHSKKSRILLKNGRYLADIIMIPLSKGDNELKFSFQKDLSLFKAYPRQMKSTVHEADFTSPTVVKETPEGEHFEISYVFEKRKLKVKQEGGEASGINRIHFDVVHPIDRPLFTLFLRDISALDKVTPEDGDYILDNEIIEEPTAIVFSFVNDSGVAFMDESIDMKKPGFQTDIELGDFEHKILRVAVQTIVLPEDLTLNFAVSFPHSTTKVT